MFTIRYIANFGCTFISVKTIHQKYTSMNFRDGQSTWPFTKFTQTSKSCIMAITRAYQIYYIALVHTIKYMWRYNLMRVSNSLIGFHCQSLQTNCESAQKQTSFFGFERRWPLLVCVQQCIVGAVPILFRWCITNTQYLKH